MATSQERRHVLIERAQQATALQAAFGQTLTEHITHETNRLVSGYRAGEPDRHFYAIAARIAILRELQDSFTYAQRQGEVAMEQEVKDGETARLRGSGER